MKTTNELNALYLRRRNKILVAQNASEVVPLNYVTTMVKNLEPLGYTFSQSLIEACTKLSFSELQDFNTSILDLLKKGKGAHKAYKPMYPNFPTQVMEMSECELYINAICHYWTGGTWTPPSEVKERFPLLDKVELRQIGLGNPEEFNALFTQLVSGNVAWGVQDKEDVEWFVQNLSAEELTKFLPGVVPQKENMAALVGLLMKHTDKASEYAQIFCKTATDVLRIAASLSGGDVSLATVTKFRNFNRVERVLILELLSKAGNPVEDMLRWKGRWIRLGEKLHVGEYKTRFPVAFEAFNVLRNNIKVETFNGVVEKALVDKDVVALVEKLSLRAGDFARRLDHVLRLDSSKQKEIVLAFGQVSGKVSTPVLLQVMTHFKHRTNQPKLRTFFPKGNVAKAQAIENTLAALPKNVCNSVVKVCEDALVERFKLLPSLGNCYLDDKLEGYGVPFALRSASKSLRTLVRGSKIPLPDNCNVLRFFCWWKNGDYRTDIDLSATMLDANFKYTGVLSYYNLRDFGGCHGGDIVDAPNGASEFIDVELSKMRESGVRYILMTLNSYTNQPYCELPECFAGWMARDKAASGEIYEPKTVVDRVDLTADSTIAIPLIIDIVENKVIWCDLSLKSHPNFNNNVHGNLKGINLTLQSFATMNKPNLYDLLALHVKARGKLVKSPSKAQTVFSVENETPFRLEEIASQYMG